MKLYGSSFSPFVRKVLVYAAERGIEMEVVQNRLGDPDPEFRRASPLGKMPGFTDGDFAISDSTAIITYLEGKYPEGAMTPADPADHARVIWYEEVADTVLSGVVFKCFFNRVVAPFFMQQPGNEELAIEGETIDLPRILDYLETIAPAPGAFLVGDKLSVADISVASMFVNFEHAQCAVDKAEYSKIYAWVAEIHQRPSFAQYVESESRTIARIRAAAA